MLSMPWAVAYWLSVNAIEAKLRSLRASARPTVPAP
ncbi:Uncharacterised protein [Bordetella pertussis]|nr:Uncharacterised protein [Bordetella pertussis]CFT92240.1 Uncharacterised protein [Bordetella pertussis]CFW50450.1 Uncharacterised protein [Bordetella pertussis]